MKLNLPAMNLVPRPKKIWRRPCGHCPSAHYPPDPESEDIARFYKEGKITAWDATFVCAWRPGKLCRGVCDNVGVTEKDFQGEEIYTW